MAAYQRQPWENQPLPSGWESKYDPGQKRYFFINHGTKNTTWEDPRKTAWNARGGAYTGYNNMYQQQQQQQHPAPQQNTNTSSSSYAWSILNSGGQKANLQPSPRVSPHPSPRPSPQPSPRASPMPSPKPSPRASPSHHEAHDPWEQQQPSSTPQASPSFKRLEQKLIEDFPTADHGVIRDVIRTSGRDESVARNSLRTFGYKQKSASPRPGSGASPRPSSGSSAKHSHHKKGDRHRSVSPKPPAPTGPSDAHKKRVAEKLTKEFSSYPTSVVEMALEASNYEESKTRMLLKSMGGSSRDASPSKSTKKPSSSASTSQSNSSVSYTNMPAPSTITANKTMDINFPKLTEFKIPSAFDERSSPSRNQFSGVGSTSIASAAPKRTAQKAKGSAAQQIKHKTTAAGVQRPRESGEYYSENRIQAVGPNPALVQGPNLDNILDNYVNAKGPNPANRQGPNPALGRNRSLAVGPNKALVCGPSHLNTKTSYVERYPDNCPIIEALSGRDM